MDRPSPEQLARYRAMSPAERWHQSERLYWLARRMRAAHERVLHPDWTEAQVEQRVREFFLDGPALEAWSDGLDLRAVADGLDAATH